jgi:hypothetical protein
MAQQTTADKVLAALEAYKLKDKGHGKYRCNSPFRPGSNSHAFTLLITDDEYGTWYDHVSGEHGSLYDLADKLGIDTPKQNGTPKPSPRTYQNLADYAASHGVDVSVFQAAGWGDAFWYGKRAIAFPTPNGTRYRLLEGDDKYIQEKGYKACLYGLEKAVQLSTNQSLVLCNGEASVVVAQHYGIAACCQNMGENILTDDNLKRLQAAYSGPIIVALDSDPKGRSVAPKLVAQLQDAGYDARAVDLGLTDGDDLADFCRLYDDQAKDALAQRKELAVATPERKLLHADELDSLPPQTWLIDGELPSNALAVLFGPSGSGKSFLALDEAARLAQTHNVVYVAAEGASGYANRKNAWKQHHNQGIGKLHFWTEAVNLMNEKEVQAFIDAISHLEKPIVYIDTLARCMVGGDENSAKDMGIAIAACDTIRRATGELVKVVHHTGKNGTSERGSSALRGAADVMIEVTDDDGVITVACSKMKDAAPFEPRHYRLLPVGDSCVIVPAAHVMVTNDAPLTNRQRKVLETLALAVFEDTGAKASQLTDCVPAGSLFRVLSELKRRGYIRQADKGDPYFITEEGKQTLRQLSSDIPHPKAQLSQLSSDYHATIDSDHTTPSLLSSLSHTFRCDSDDSDSDSKHDVIETAKPTGHTPRPPAGTSMAVRLDISQQRFDAARNRMESNPGCDWMPELEMLEAAERAAHGGET